MCPETLLIQKVCVLEVVHVISCCGDRTISRFTYTNGKNRNADIHAAIGFQPREPSFRDAGINEFIVEVFGRDMRMDEAVESG
jgi:hypothetical protein